MFIALVPFLSEIRRSKTLVQTIVQGSVFGICVIGGSTVATLFAGLASGIGALGLVLERVLVVSSWLLFFVPLVPAVVIFAILFRAVGRLSFVSGVFLVVVWVGLEYVRMFLFNIATYAPDVGNPPFFSAGFLGYVLADNSSFLQLASLGGVYLLSAVVLSVNILIYRALQVSSAHLRTKSLAWIFAGVLCIALVPIASLREHADTRPHTPLTVGLMALYPKDEEEFVRQTEEAVTSLLRTDADLIVLPEGAAYPENVPAEKTNILGTRFSNRGDLYANVAEVGFAGEEREVVRGKSILAAQGEYVVGLFAWGATLFGLEKELVRFSANGSLTSMRWGESFPVGEHEVRVSALFCVEMLAPFIGADVVKKEHSHLLAFMLSHRQFNGAYTLRVDTERFLKVRAVEAGVPLVASSRETKAYAIDAHGRVLTLFGEEESAWGAVIVSVLSTGQMK